MLQCRTIASNRPPGQTEVKIKTFGGGPTGGHKLSFTGALAPAGPTPEPPLFRSPRQTLLRIKSLNIRRRLDQCVGVCNMLHSRSTVIVFPCLIHIQLNAIDWNYSLKKLYKSKSKIGSKQSSHFCKWHKHMWIKTAVPQYCNLKHMKYIFSKR